jgi:hypothetical protein
MFPRVPYSTAYARGELKSKGLRVEIRFSIPKFIQADFVPNPVLILFGLIAPRAIKVVADPPRR